ncbi:uncharacterized protein FOMMEDRAFT_138017 [Fomitiporia mediterranea MF3/22]|uniref:uncharacterized protein n=1 Tax=Fomitiporia mediterranea (strain MF3/22) TaxID=694068 RepID=UPI0004407923|nr:uncharacterized protein FOMMEDRAFT_138017 [Fomitiporia mediterranea MF3/22]EJD07901.1 hypothetical protein FOMMEDRAFT_138017 [Fomitiporia mediterranea MF3/22]
MLKHMSESSAAFRMLSSVFWLWLRSHGIDHYSWMTCAFLVMYSLQAHFRLPSLPTSGIQSPSQEFLSKANSGSNQVLQRLNIPSVPSIADLPDNPGVLLCKFFSFWANSKHIPYNYVLDSIGGTYTPRKQKYRANGKDLDEAQIMKGLRTLSIKGIKDAYWDYNPLVLVDPFLPYHNLAHMVTKHALHLMFHRAHFAAYALKHGQPVTEIFGTEGRSLPDTYAWKQGVAWLPSPSSQSTSLPHPFQRTYYTSARAKRSKLPPPTIHALPGVPRYVLANRERTIKRVERAIRKRYGNQYTVECFGSTQYGVDSPTSDLDLVILDHDRENGFSPDVSTRSLPVVYNVQNLARSLEYNGFRVFQTIPTASVPIVKFEDPRTNLNCDINVNDRLGLCNTRLIAQYCKLSPLLRPLLGLIKKWAKTTGLNDPSGDKGTATFSSYSLTLMTIGFLQAHEQLPNLQAGLPPLTAEDAFWLRGKDNVRTRCDPRFDQNLSWSPPEDAVTFDLRGVLCAWFRYWGHQYNYSLDVMSIRDGGVIPRVDKAETTLTADKQGKKRAKVLARRSQRDRKRAEKEARAGRNTSSDAKETESFVDELTGERVELELESEDVVEEAGEEETAAVEDLDDTALEEMAEADLEQGKQPRSWALAALVVADPFILSKNATGAITVRAIERFTAECRRALLLLSAEADFEDLLGDGSAIGRRGGRGRRGGKGKGDRGRGGRAEWMTRGRQGSRGRADQGEKEKRETSRSSGGNRNRDGDGDGRRARSDSRGNNGGEKDSGEVRLKESGSSRGQGRGYGHGSGRGRGGERPVQSRGSGRGTEREDRNAGQEADPMRYNGPGRWATRSLAIRRGTGNANTRANPS